MRKTIFYVLAILAFTLASFAPAQAQGHSTFKTIFTFTSKRTGGAPETGLVRDAAGNLYGTTRAGGAFALGTVYKLDPFGRETLLYSFTGGDDGAYPYGSLILDEAGNLYGTTDIGGTGCVMGCGTVFKLDPTGNETVLYRFAGGVDGAGPEGSLIRDAAGSFYGTTGYGGGSIGCNGGCGTVFKLDPAGKETALYSFTGGADGWLPTAGLIRDPAGNLYGTAAQGGQPTCPLGCGVVFKLEPTGALTLVHSFTGSPDGESPFANLIRDTEGNLYGTTFYGGGGCGLGCGTVFKLDPAGAETVLYRFSGGVDGYWPWGGLIRDTAGNLFGTAIGGGAFNLGVVFKLDPTGAFTVLHSFAGGATSGAYPWAGLIGDQKGNLYGTTSSGGPSTRCYKGCGTVYRVTP